MTEHEQLVSLFEKMGSTKVQAETLARQLAKRADQLSAERGISRVEAMSHLLQLLAKARQGES
ncbi:MAG TPA: hypothetical protein VFT72_06795 [Opitutaceae bacterium]|nr:hypothetical protein [Opitutaceae bacterium]